MRIGFDAKRYFLNRTGLGNYSRDLIRILTEFYPENEYIKYTTKIGNAEITPDLTKTTRLPKTSFDKILPSLWRNQSIVKDLVKDKIELFHGLSGEIPKGLYKQEIKSVVTIHDLIFLKHPELYKPLDRYIYNKKFKHAVLNADKVIAISEQTKRDIISYYGVNAEQIDVIYQGCHPAFKVLKTTAQKEQIHAKYNLPTNFLLNVGTIEPRKNALQIVKAIEQIDIPLVIIGRPTAYASEIQSYIQKRGLENKVLFLHGLSMDELAVVYAMASIFVYPSIYEGFGIPIIEALYSGTPVITTNSGVFPEAGGPFSYYVDPNNSDQLGYAINSILEHGTMRKQMVDEGLKYVQRFNDDTIAGQWNALYKALLT